MDFLFVANNEPSVVQSDIGGSDKKDNFPDHPGERPTKVAHKRWALKWRASLSQIGYAAPLRGEEPFEVKKLKDRDLITDPGLTASPPAPSAAIASENARITHLNEQNKLERESRMDEIKNRLASKLCMAMERSCPLRLKRLQTKHATKDAHGVAIENSYDGVAMFLEEEKAANDGDVGEYDTQRYESAYEKLRDNPLKVNCSPQIFSDRINLFATHVNPYLGDTELKGARLGKFILAQLPEELGADVRTLKRELTAKGTISDAVEVTKEALELVESAHKPSKPTSPDIGVHLVAACFGAVLAGAPNAPPTTDGTRRDLGIASGAAPAAAGTAESNLVAEVQRQVALAHAQGASLSGKAKKKAAKRAAAAMAAAAALNDKPVLKGGFRLPDGQRCSKGSCGYAHDIKYPGEPCYRDITWGGPLPQKVYDNAPQRARIEADRVAEGKRLGRPVLPLQPPGGVGTHVALPGGDTVPPSLSDMLTSFGFMLDIGGGAQFDDAQDDHGGYGLLDTDFVSPGGQLCQDADEDSDDEPPEVPPCEAQQVLAGLQSPSSPQHASTQGTFSTPVLNAPPARQLACQLTSADSSPNLVVAPSLARARAVMGDGDDGAGVGFGSSAAPVAVAPVAPTSIAPPVAHPPTSTRAQVQASETTAAPVTAPSLALPSTRVPNASAAPAPIMYPPRAQSLFAPEPESLVAMAGRVGIALMVGLLIVALVTTASIGVSGSHVAMCQVLTACCTRGGMGMTRAFLLTSVSDSCIDVQPMAPVPPLNLLASIGAFVFVVMMMAESALIASLQALAYRLARGALNCMNPFQVAHRVARQVVVGVGFTSLIFLLMVSVTGINGQTETGSSSMTMAGPFQGWHVPPSIVDMAQLQVDRVPGVVGDRMRYVSNNVSAIYRKQVNMPSFMNKADARTMAFNIGGIEALTRLRKGEVLDIGDTGAAVDVVVNAKNAVPGSVRPNTLAVKTANGTVVPPTKCDHVLTLELEDGTCTSVLLEGALIMDTCAHNLVSLGKLASQQHVGCCLGAGALPSFLQIGSSRAPILNLGVIVIPKPGELRSERVKAAMGAVAHGARGVKHLDQSIVHARGNHTHWSTLQHWHKCANAPKEWGAQWAANASDKPCDDCLKANAPEIGSDRHGPKPTEPGDLMSMDVYSLGLRHVHGGQSKVLGIHDHYSTFNFLVLLKDESTDEIMRGWREFRAYCNSKKVTIRSVYTDNGASFVSQEFRTFMRDEIKANYSTISPYSPRSNGAIERQWRTLGNATRAMLSKSKLPRNYAWYALDQAWRVQNTLPLKHNVSTCAYTLFTGERPSVTHFRVFGCVVYAKVYNTITKMADQARRCVHLGRAPNQSGYLCYEPQTRRMYVSTHCKFVETACPGITLNAHMWESVIPDFADEFDTDSIPFDSTEMLDAPTGDLMSGPVAEPLIQGGTQDEAQGSRVDPVDDDTISGEVNRNVAAQPIRSPRQPDPPLSATRTRRVPQQVDRLGFVTAMTAMASSAFSALKPGGEAHGTQFLGLNESARGSFTIYLCSGPSREGDFSSWIRSLSASEVYNVNVDIEAGGYAHDLSSPEVAARLVKLASDPNCIGVLATIPCSTWSPARWLQPGPPPLRDISRPSGIPDKNGELPGYVEKANRIAQHAIQIADAVATHGGHFIFENPVGRDRASQFAIAGREDHASLWTLPAMVEFSRRHGELVVHFDQCRTGAATQKTTQLLCSLSVIAAVRERLGAMVCNHPPGTHASIVGTNNDGVYATKAAENFTPELNRHLAEAMLSAQPRSAGWIAAVGSIIEPFTNSMVNALSYVTAYSTVRAAVNDQDPLSLLKGIAALYGELDEHDQQWADDTLAELAPLVDRIGLYHVGVIVPESWTTLQAFALDAVSRVETKGVYKVADARRGDADHPTYKQAMAGPERTAWMDAMNLEMSNLSNANVYVEVPEDSLPSWNPVRKSASELVDMMWVLVGKYNELLERVKLKARATVRGDQEVSVDVKAGRSPAETFAPTVRHNTLKMLMAASVVRAASAAPVQGTRTQQRQQSLDITAAFLQGDAPDDRVRYVRPPPGFQTYDRRGVRIVWKIVGNVYGTTTAPRVFNRTLHEFLVGAVDPSQAQMTIEQIDHLDSIKGGLGMTQSEFDPCYYYKKYSEDERLDLACYVDDCWCTDNSQVNADRDLALLHKRFGITLSSTPKHFLNMNVIQHSPTKITVTSEAYIERMADRYVPDWRTRATVSMPAGDGLMKAYERAHQREVPPSADRLRSYGGKVGALVYTSPCVRVDACSAIGRCSRALTFPTEEMELIVDDIIVYLAQTKSLGVTFDGTVPNAGQCYAETDSDWAVGHSTTGWCVYLAGAAMCYSSKRQTCIASSSTEAEIISASSCALELVHMRGLLHEMGLPQNTTPVFVDNSGAVELSRDRKSCHRSRHVDRRYFKVRELAFEGQLRVEHIDTKLNSSDLLTKPLPLPVFMQHRRRLMNLSHE